MLRAGVDSRDRSNRDNGHGIRSNHLGKAGATVIWHILRLHGQRRFRGVGAFNRIHTLDVVAEQWIVAQIGAKPGEIIGVGEVYIIPMLDVHVPTHEAHLKTEDGWIFTII